MYRKVLVPVDGTREAEGLSQIILEDLATDGELVLLQIIPPARTRVVGGHVLIGSQQDESERGNALSYLRSPGWLRRARPVRGHYRRLRA